MQAETIFPRFSDAEYRRRYAAVRAEMARRGVDAVIAAGDSAFRFSNHANVQWLTNWLDPYAAYAVITLEQDPILVISNPLYLHTARRASVATEVHGVYTPGRTMGERLIELGLAGGTIGLAGVRNVGRASMAYEHQRELAATMPDARFVDALDIMQEARRIKSAEEIVWFEKGAEYTDRAVMAVADSLRDDMPEFELSARIQESFLDDGGALMFHFLGATPMEAPELIFPWQYPSTRRIRAGDVLLTEISVGHWGYAGQVQRAYTVGSEPTTEFRQLHDTAAECYHRVFEVLKPGATDRDIIEASRFVERRGYKTLDVLIHGWGITIEPPRADLRCAMIKRECLPFTVEEGMLFVVQPHIVSGDEKRGVQVGNLVSVEKIGPRSLQKSPMDFFRSRHTS
ncbi:ectoine hydrolase [Nitrobacteraceae bacterium AZCC 2161]